MVRRLPSETGVVAFSARTNNGRKLMNSRLSLTSAPLVAVLLAACSDTNGGQLSLAVSSIRPIAPVASAGLSGGSAAGAPVADSI